MKTMKKVLAVSAVILAAAAVSGCGSTSSSQSDSSGAATNHSTFKEGTKVYAIVNVHADSPRNRLYAMNYQLPRMMPICSEFIIEDIETKVIELSYKGLDYDYIWDKYTRSGGQSLEENFSLFFAESCDETKAKIETLSEIDQKGISKGKPLVGMTKEAILLAMGRPPIHATPDLEANTWTYWINKWARNMVEFDDSGKVKQIIK